MISFRFLPAGGGRTKESRHSREWSRRSFERRVTQPRGFHSRRPSTLSLTELMKEMEESTLWNEIGTRPPMMSITDVAAPLVRDVDAFDSTIDLSISASR
jgi:hypothetical protein